MPPLSVALEEEEEEEEEEFNKSKGPTCFRVVIDMELSPSETPCWAA
jgi:hypothetical protein